MSRYRLWRLTPDHAESWREIRLTAMTLAPEAFGSSFDDWAGRPLSDYAAQLERCDCWAAGLDEARPLAVAAWEPELTGAEPDLGWVTSVFVRPEARGQGLGDLLLDRLMRRAGQAGMTRLALHVPRDNHSACRLYRRMGFLPTGAVPATGAGGQVLIEMRRLIRPALIHRLRALYA